MSDAIITVENLGKRYRLGAGRSNERYTALRDVVAEAAMKPFRSLKDKFKFKNGSDRPSSTSASTSTSNLNSEASASEFWALKDVSFEVRQGEVLGIIGRNGAGKSTLLKILSRITEPTEGRIKIRGRVASLLEVGTGFHPELTGRENIFLNGAILGMHRHEIKAKFDEIVAFAEVEKFLDTPVKRYSSGMYVRLAFAVAAHLEPEILIVDEVLAVGDGEFQKKCLGKMQEVAQGQGRTVLFVSHNMAAVQNLCSSGLLLMAGRAEPKADIVTMVQRYLKKEESHPGKLIAVQGKGIEIRSLYLHRTGDEAPVNRVVFNQAYALSLNVFGATGSERVAPVIDVFDERQVLVSSICGPEEGLDFQLIDGACRFEVDLGFISLMPGKYRIMVRVFGIGPEPLLELTTPLEFEVEGAVLPSAFRAYRADHGVVRIAAGIEIVR